MQEKRYGREACLDTVGAYCGCSSGKHQVFRCHDNTESPHGRHGMRRLLQYSRICEQLRLNICGKSALRSKFMGQYGFAQDSVGADAHIGSRSMCRFYGNLRRTCNFQMGQCGHRPLQPSGEVHTDLTQIFIKLSSSAVFKRTGAGGWPAP